ncbi:MAG TPA: transcriptional repressor [bacterium]|nr:transcriptional repressor [bacterium]
MADGRRRAGRQAETRRGGPELLPAAGVRCTTARAAVLAHLKDCACHATADSIFRALRPRHVHLGLTTVYRTLQLLARLGQVQKIEGGDGKAHYELAGASAVKPHHHHLVCQTCGAIIDHADFVPGEQDTMHRIMAALERKYGFRATGHNVQFAGTCATCRHQPDNNRRTRRKRQ